MLQSRLWKGRHRHHDYEEYITIVLIIPYIASPLTHNECFTHAHSIVLLCTASTRMQDNRLTSHAVISTSFVYTPPMGSECCLHSIYSTNFYPRVCNGTHSTCAAKTHCVLVHFYINAYVNNL